MSDKRKRSIPAGVDAGTFNSWRAMLMRCRNPKWHGYKYYGGRGISVCERWLRLLNFVADMGPRPDGMFLERKDNNLGYCKGNCVWATRLEQARNKRWSKGFTVNGVSVTAIELSEMAGVSWSLVYKLSRKGLSAEDILKRPKYTAYKKTNA